MGSGYRDKTVIITGGSAGVGAATARRFAMAGARLVLVARDEARLERSAAELRREAAEVLTLPMDVADEASLPALFERAAGTFGAVHYLINNAGYHARGRVEDVDAEELGRMIDVNLRAPVQLCRHAIPWIREAGGGAIVNVASLAGRTPIAGAAVYSASKFGLRAFTFALAAELEGSGIRVAAVSPGPVDTAFIMSDIDHVADITFSQPLSTAGRVAEAILEIASAGGRERAIPAVSGLLTTASYLFPGVSRLLQPAMSRKGRRAKEKLKAQLRTRPGITTEEGDGNGGQIRR